jgi:1,4-dihydroxy-2-naphthoate octaprenyltransferase
MGLLSGRALKRAMVLVFALAAVVGLYLSIVAGPGIVWVGAISILVAIAYTGGPWPLGYHGLGDLAVFIFFGLVAVVGTSFVQTGEIEALAFVVAVPVGALATAILVVNNLRDIDTDRAAGKRTLAVRWGRRGARCEWAILVGGAYLMTLVPWLGFGEAPWVLLPWLSAYRAGLLWRVIGQSEAGLELDEALAGTAQLGFVFSILFALGLGA